MNYLFPLLIELVGGFFIGFGVRGVLDYYKNKKVKGYKTLYEK